jgi:hypothetical protein
MFNGAPIGQVKALAGSAGPVLAMEHGWRPQERIRQHQSIFRDRLQGAQEIHHPGRPHGPTATHQYEIDADLLEF